MKWYFTPATDQERTFGLRYTLHGALGIDPAGDELYWKFIERDRSYPIESATVRVHLPAAFEVGQLQARTYRDGAPGTGGRIVDGRTVEFTGGPFPSGVEWEVRSGFPHGAVSATPPAWQTSGQAAALTPAAAPAALRQAASAKASSGGGDWAAALLVAAGILVLGLVLWTAVSSEDPGSGDCSDGDSSSGRWWGGGWSGGGSSGGSRWSGSRGSGRSSRRSSGGGSRRTGGGGGGGSSGFG